MFVAVLVAESAADSQIVVIVVAAGVAGIADAVVAEIADTVVAETADAVVAETAGTGGADRSGTVLDTGIAVTVVTVVVAGSGGVVVAGSDGVVAAEIAVAVAGWAAETDQFGAGTAVQPAPSVLEPAPLSVAGSGLPPESVRFPAQPFALSPALWSPSLRYSYPVSPLQRRCSETVSSYPSRAHRERFLLPSAGTPSSD